MTPPPATLTLAELYARQGLVGRAREIFQQVARDGTPEQRMVAAARLAELGPSAQESIDLLRSLMGRVQKRRRTQPG